MRVKAKKLSSRQEDILTVLQRDGLVTAYTLGTILDAPEASVRRDIGTLRRSGFDISFAEGTSMYRYYGYNPSYVY